MGKSAKAKKEKKKDFQKVKLKVGKTKPKATNSTDTSFKARCKKSSPHLYTPFNSNDSYSNIRTPTIPNLRRALHLRPILPPSQPPQPQLRNTKEGIPRLPHDLSKSPSKIPTSTNLHNPPKGPTFNPRCLHSRTVPTPQTPSRTPRLRRPQQRRANPPLDAPRPHTSQFGHTPQQSRRARMAPQHCGQGSRIVPGRMAHDAEMFRGAAWVG